MMLIIALQVAAALLRGKRKNHSAGSLIFSGLSHLLSVAGSPGLLPVTCCLRSNARTVWWE